MSVVPSYGRVMALDLEVQTGLVQKLPREEEVRDDMTLVCSLTTLDRDEKSSGFLKNLSRTIGRIRSPGHKILIYESKEECE